MGETTSARHRATVWDWDEATRAEVRRYLLEALEEPWPAGSRRRPAEQAAPLISWLGYKLLARRTARALRRKKAAMAAARAAAWQEPGTTGMGDKTMTTIQARLRIFRADLLLAMLLVGAFAAGCVGDYING